MSWKSALQLILAGVVAVFAILVGKAIAPTIMLLGPVIGAVATGGAIILLLGLPCLVIYAGYHFVNNKRIETRIRNIPLGEQLAYLNGREVWEQPLLGGAAPAPSSYHSTNDLKSLTRIMEIGREVPAGLIEGPHVAQVNELPTSVRYEDIRHQVPRGHVLVGIGKQGIETREKAIGACVWICGLSGTGKTSTTVLRVEERSADGHKFLGIDPHWFKPDSLSNAISGYSDRFLMPIAKTTEDQKRVLNAFLTEFNARKSGQRPKPWQKVTLLVDEVGAIMDTTNKEEEVNADLIKTIARICGQEARNFEMGGIFISQQATGLSWLRKMALMVIIHQLLMDSEKKIACNEDRKVMEDMKKWPIGRTYVYGVGFQDGPRTVQQPFFEKEVIEADSWDIEEERDTDPESSALPIDEDLREALEAWENGAKGPRAMQRVLGCTYYRAQQLCADLVEKRLVESD